jgi:hypothetical protein
VIDATRGVNAGMTTDAVEESIGDESEGVNAGESCVKDEE